MSTQLELARAGQVTRQMIEAGVAEELSPECIRAGVAAGQIVIPTNPNRPTQRTVAIGAALRTKVNASIGTSSDIIDIAAECRKARAAEEEGADTLMELSVGGDLDEIRRTVLAGPRCRSAMCRSTRLFARRAASTAIRINWTRKCSSTSSSSNAPTASASWPSTAASTSTPSSG